MSLFESRSFQVLLDQTKHLKPLTRKQEAALARKIAKGDTEAANALVMHNLRFIVSVAGNFARQGAYLDDLVNAGVIGGLSAARKFDSRRGVKFITFAHLYIKQQMQKSMADGQWAVKVPDNTMGAMKRVSAALEELLQHGNNNPSPEDVAKLAGIHAASAAGVMIAKSSATSLESYEISGFEDGVRWKDAILDDGDSPDVQATDSDTKDKISKLLSGLNPRQRTVLYMRFGLGGGDGMTLDKVGEQLGITRERVRQLQNQAIDRIMAFMDPDLVNDLGAVIGFDHDECARRRVMARNRINGRRVDHAAGRIARGEYGVSIMMWSAS